MSEVVLTKDLIRFLRERSWSNADSAVSFNGGNPVSFGGSNAISRVMAMHADLLRGVADRLERLHNFCEGNFSEMRVALVELNGWMQAFPDDLRFRKWKERVVGMLDEMGKIQ